MCGILYGDMFNSLLKRRTSTQYVYIIVLVFSVIGLLCSFILTQEKFEILKNANATLSCSINAVLDCGPVIRSHQASAFGFMNTLIGLATFSSLITIAVAGLSGVKFKKWFMLGLEIGTGLGLIFAYWLLYQSAVIIGALCPYCVTTTFSVTMIFAAVTHLNILQDNLHLPKKLSRQLKAWLKRDIDKYFWLIWVAIIVGLLIIHFRSHL